MSADKGAGIGAVDRLRRGTGASGIGSDGNGSGGGATIGCPKQWMPLVFPE
jgi:hypothetical protein